MSSWRPIIGSAAAGLIVLTAPAVAQSKDDRELPTGDVWITLDHPYSFYLQPKAMTPNTGMALGDVWVVLDQDERRAQLKSERQEAKEPITSKVTPLDGRPLTGGASGAVRRRVPSA
jgi:hypothetical protein